MPDTASHCLGLVFCSANEVADAGGGDEEAREVPLGMDALVGELAARVPRQPRSADGAFLFAIDHCFAIRGQGTVLTGTVLQAGAAEILTVAQHVQHTLPLNFLSPKSSTITCMLYVLHNPAAKGNACHLVECYHNLRVVGWLLCRAR